MKSVLRQRFSPWPFLLLLLCGWFSPVAGAADQTGAKGLGSVDLDQVYAPLEPENRNRQSYGLFLGVNEFESASGLPNLQYAVNDATALAYTFVVDLLLIPPTQTWLALGGEPTGDNRERLAKLRQLGVHTIDPSKVGVIDAVEKILRLAENHKALIFTSFSSHGFESDGEAYIMPVDARVGRYTTSQTGVPLKMVKQMLHDAQASKNILLIDACRETPATGGKGATALDPAFESALETAEGSAVLLSCSPGQLSWEYPDIQHGVFTYYFIRGLLGEATAESDTGYITLGSVSRYAATETDKWVRENKKGQRQIPKNNFELGAESIPLAISPRVRAQAMASFDAWGQGVGAKVEANLNYAQAKGIIGADDRKSVWNELKELREGGKRTRFDELTGLVLDMLDAKNPHLNRYFLSTWQQFQLSRQDDGGALLAAKSVSDPNSPPAPTPLAPVIPIDTAALEAAEKARQLLDELDFRLAKNDLDGAREAFRRAAAEPALSANLEAKQKLTVLQNRLWEAEGRAATARVETLLQGNDWATLGTLLAEVEKRQRDGELTLDQNKLTAWRERWRQFQSLTRDETEIERLAATNRWADAAALATQTATGFRQLGLVALAEQWQAEQARLTAEYERDGATTAALAKAQQSRRSGNFPDALAHLDNLSPPLPASRQNEVDTLRREIVREWSDWEWLRLRDLAAAADFSQLRKDWDRLENLRQQQAWTWPEAERQSIQTALLAYEQGFAAWTAAQLAEREARFDEALRQTRQARVLLEQAGAVAEARQALALEDAAGRQLAEIRQRNEALETLSASIREGKWRDAATRATAWRADSMAWPAADQARLQQAIDSLAAAWLNDFRQRREVALRDWQTPLFASLLEEAQSWPLLDAAAAETEMAPLHLRRQHLTDLAQRQDLAEAAWREGRLEEAVQLERAIVQQATSLGHPQKDAWAQTLDTHTRLLTAWQQRQSTLASVREAIRQSDWTSAQALLQRLPERPDWPALLRQEDTRALGGYHQQIHSGWLTDTGRRVEEVLRGWDLDRLATLQAELRQRQNEGWPVAEIGRVAEIDGRLSTLRSAEERRRQATEAKNAGRLAEALTAVQEAAQHYARVGHLERQREMQTLGQNLQSELAQTRSQEETLARLQSLLSAGNFPATSAFFESLPSALQEKAAVRSVMETMRVAWQSAWEKELSDCWQREDLDAFTRLLANARGYSSHQFSPHWSLEELSEQAGRWQQGLSFWQQARALTQPSAAEEAARHCQNALASLSGLPLPRLQEEVAQREQSLLALASRRARLQPAWAASLRQLQDTPDLSALETSQQLGPSLVTDAPDWAAALSEAENKARELVENRALAHWQALPLADDPCLAPAQLKAALEQSKQLGLSRLSAAISALSGPLEAACRARPLLARIDSARQAQAWHEVRQLAGEASLLLEQAGDTTRLRQTQSLLREAEDMLALGMRRQGLAAEASALIARRQFAEAWAFLDLPAWSEDPTQQATLRQTILEAWTADWENTLTQARQKADFEQLLRWRTAYQDWARQYRVATSTKLQSIWDDLTLYEQTLRDESEAGRLAAAGQYDAALVLQEKCLALWRRWQLPLLTPAEERRSAWTKARDDLRQREALMAELRQMGKTSPLEAWKQVEQARRLLSSDARGQAFLAEWIPPLQSALRQDFLRQLENAASKANWDALRSVLTQLDGLPFSPLPASDRSPYDTALAEIESARSDVEAARQALARNDLSLMRTNLEAARGKFQKWKDQSALTQISQLEKESSKAVAAVEKAEGAEYLWAILEKARQTMDRQLAGNRIYTTKGAAQWNNWLKSLRKDYKALLSQDKKADLLLKQLEKRVNENTLNEMIVW